jgi:hypothetical protein
LRKPTKFVAEETVKSEGKFHIDDSVWARAYRGPKRWILGRITKLIGKYMYEIDLDGKIWKRHQNQLRLNSNRIQPPETETDLFDRLPEAEVQQNVPPKAPTPGVPAIPVAEPTVPIPVVDPPRSPPLTVPPRVHARHNLRPNPRPNNRYDPCH